MALRREAHWRWTRQSSLLISSKISFQNEQIILTIKCYNISWRFSKLCSQYLYFFTMIFIQWNIHTYILLSKRVQTEIFHFVCPVLSPFVYISYITNHILSLMYIQPSVSLKSVSIRQMWRHYVFSKSGTMKRNVRLVEAGKPLNLRENFKNKANDFIWFDLIFIRKKKIKFQQNCHFFLVLADSWIRKENL